MNWNSAEFLRAYVGALRQGTAAIFIGAGLSQPAGYVNWRDLLRKAAEDLGLDIEQEMDLVGVAQFYLNHSGSRHPINQLLVEKFPMKQPTEAHKLIASLPIRTLWTTNYDRLVETAFKDAGKNLQAIRTITDLSLTKPDREAVLYKLHGDIETPDTAVLTRDDYELFATRQETSIFAEKLKGDLIDKTFLFVGFSFEDPNLDHVLARIRVLMGNGPKKHYWLVKTIDPAKGATAAEQTSLEYQKKRQEHRIKDLIRYGITAIRMDSYSRVTELLAVLKRLVKMNRVFVGGAVSDPNPLGKDQLKELVTGLGQMLTESGYTIVTGFGKDVGPDLVYGAIRGCLTESKDISRVLDARPFPFSAPVAERSTLCREHRVAMLRTCGIAVFLSGNKDDTNGGIVNSPGAMEEFEICESEGVNVIPIGCTGHAAKTIADKVMSDPGKYLPDVSMVRSIKTLGDSGLTVREIIEEVKSLIVSMTRI